MNEIIAKEAVKQIKENCYFASISEKTKQALEMAIKALEQQPKPMEKFDDVKTHIQRLAGDYKCWDNRLTWEEALELNRMLEAQPCEDAVSREEINEFINVQLTDNEEWASSATYEGRWVEEKKYLYGVEILEGLSEYVNDLPSVTPRINLAETSQDCISREEVQDLISRWLSDYLLDETREALETINYKVGDMPSVTPSYNSIKTELKPCEDCISREAVVEHICEGKECYKEECKGRTLKRCPDLQWVFDLPSVTPKYTDEEIDKAQAVEQAYVDKMVELAVKEIERPKGHWIIIDDCELFMAKCSECGEIVDSRMINKYPYCHCGAEMEGEE